MTPNTTTKKLPGRPKPGEDTSLYWNSHGQVSCLAHAPGRGTDTWKWEKWKKMKPAEVAECAKEGIGCETCDAKRAHEIATAMTDDERDVLLAIEMDDEEQPVGRTYCNPAIVETFVRLGYVSDGLTMSGRRIASAVHRLRGED